MTDLQENVQPLILDLKASYAKVKQEAKGKNVFLHTYSKVDRYMRLHRVYSLKKVHTGDLTVESWEKALETDYQWYGIFHNIEDLVTEVVTYEQLPPDIQILISPEAAWTTRQTPAQNKVNP